MAKRQEASQGNVDSAPLKVAAAQIAPALCRVAENVEVHRRCILEAKRQAAELVVFPELSLTGYDLIETATCCSCTAS